jgi:hypothetical protein
MGCRAHLTTDLEQKKPTAPARPRLQSGRHVDHNTGDMKGDDKTQVGGQNRTRINVNEDCEVRDWCKSLGVTQDETAQGGRRRPRPCRQGARAPGQDVVATGHGLRAMRWVAGGCENHTDRPVGGDDRRRLRPRGRRGPLLMHPQAIFELAAVFACVDPERVKFCRQ